MRAMPPSINITVNVSIGYPRHTSRYEIVIQKTTALHKREGYISWDEYFMGVALLSAHRSKDPNTQVGACIVNNKNKIVGAGYNGLPRGCDDNDFPSKSREIFWIRSMLTYAMQNSTPYLTISVWILVAAKFTRFYFPATNVLKQLYRPALQR